MQILNHKNQALVIGLLAGLTVLNPISADEEKKGDQINIGLSEELSNISIKKIRKLGGKEFSYQNADNNIILVKCNSDKILVKYWYVNKLDSSTPQEATSKMHWHRAAPKSQTQRESELLCSTNNNQRN